MEIKEIQEAVEASLKSLTAEHKLELKKCNDTAEKALAEIKSFATITTETNEALKKHSETALKLQADLLDVQQKFDKFKLAGGGPEAAKSVGQIIVDSEEYKAAQKSGAPKMERVEVGTFHKATIINAVGQNQPLVSAERAPFLTPQTTPLRIRSLMPIRTTESNLIEYAKEGVYTNAAAIVAETIAKPESALTFTMAIAPIVTIAHWIPASRQVLADAKMLLGYVEDRLIYGVEFAEEGEILNGDGTAGHMDGLMHQATAYTGHLAPDQQLDTLLRAMMQVWTGSLFYPDGAVINPIDWMNIRLLKDTLGRYIFGDPNSNQSPSVWGQNLVPSMSIAATNFLVGAFRPGVMLWDREQANVRVAEQHADFYVRNMVAILAEERMGLTVFRPSAFVKGVFIAPV